METYFPPASGHTEHMLNLILRTVTIFAVLLTLMRLLGKRQLGELELSELVVSIMVADVASVPLQDPKLSLWFGIVPAVTLFLCEYFLATLTMKSVSIRKIVCGKPCFLIKDGIIQQTEMRRCRFTLDELAEELRSRDVFDISTVQYAVLETDGSLNVILTPAERPATAGQLGLDVQDEGYGIILVEDGVLLRENLAISGHSEDWLRGELRRQGCPDLRQVYALIVYGSGRVFFAKKHKA